MKVPKRIQKLYNTGRMIDVNIHHKMVALKRKKDILKMKNDIENEQIMPHNFQGTHPRIKGYRPAKKRINWGMVLVWLLILPLLWIIIIGLIDLL